MGRSMVGWVVGGLRGCWIVKGVVRWLESLLDG